MLSTIFLGLTLLFIVGGFLLGMLRGNNRSILRLILVVLCVVVAFVAKVKVVDAAFSLELDTETANSIAGAVGAELTNGENTIETMLPAILNSFYDGLGSMGDSIIGIVKLLLSVLIFLLVFWVLRFISWLIIFQLCKIFVKKGKKKRALLGGVVGLLTGAIIAVFVCIPLSALTVNGLELANELSAMLPTDSGEGGGSEGEGGEGGQTAYVPFGSRVAYAEISSSDLENPTGESAGGSMDSLLGDLDIATMLEEYKNSPIGKIYTKIGEIKIGESNVLHFLTDYKDAGKDKVYTFDAQIGALKGMAKMAGAAAKLQNIEFSNISADDISELKDLLSSLDEMGPEAKAEVGGLISGAATSLLGEDMPGLAEAFETIDFAEIDFATEGEVIAEILDFSSKLTNLEEGQDLQLEEGELGDLVETISESQMILPLLEGVGIVGGEGDGESINLSEGLTESQMEEVTQALEGLSDDNANKEALYKLFGLTLPSGN